MQLDIESLRQLPIVEKLRVVELLWDDISRSNDSFPFSDEMRHEVGQRIAEYDQQPDDGLTREEFWQSVDERRV